MDVDPVGALLQAVGMAEAAEEPFDRCAAADEVGLSPGDLRGLVQHVEGLGLAVVGEDERLPVLMGAGRQFLRLGCVFDEDALGFLPRTIDDLFARRALLCGGSVLVDTFRGDLIAGNGVEHAREIVPPAFERAVDEGLALNLFVAAVSLMTRLSTDQPAGCMAEEVIAVSLINEARTWLELEADSGELSAPTAAAAIDVLPDLFALFEDDDVLRVFDMREPADAVLDGVRTLRSGSASPISDWRRGLSRSEESRRPGTWTTPLSRRRPRRRSRGRKCTSPRPSAWQGLEAEARDAELPAKDANRVRASARGAVHYHAFGRWFSESIRIGCPPPSALVSASRVRAGRRGVLQA